MSVRDRMKKVDVEKMDLDKIEQLSAQIGDKVAKKLQVTANELNEMLNVYGLEIILNYNLKPKSQVSKKDKE